MKARTILSILLILICSVSVFATAQTPDRIIFEGKEYSLQTNPMEDYFRKFPERRPKGGIVSSGNWRGYVATFEFTDGSLYLKDIVAMFAKPNSEKSFETESRSVKDQVVPDGKRLKIDWFTGILVLPYGKMVQYVHMGYGSTFEKYILIEVAEGDFKKEKRFNYKEYENFKDRQFEAFKKTEEYKKYVEEMKKEGSDQEFIDSFLRSFVTNYTSKILVD